MTATGLQQSRHELRQCIHPTDSEAGPWWPWGGGSARELPVPPAHCSPDRDLRGLGLGHPSGGFAGATLPFLEDKCLYWASLVAQWQRIHLPTQVQPLGREDPTRDSTASGPALHCETPCNAKPPPPTGEAPVHKRKTSTTRNKQICLLK